MMATPQCITNCTVYMLLHGVINYVCMLHVHGGLCCACTLYVIALAIIFAVNRSFTAYGASH